LSGKIAFQSNYFGKTRLFLVDPDGGNLALLVASWVYDVAIAGDRLSPDGRYYVKQGQGNNGLDLFVGPVGGGEAKRLTFVGQGKAWDWAWAPDGRHIAFTSNQEGDDDIFVVKIWTPEDPLPQTTKLAVAGSWESDKHPSYSPDGSQIVFYSNRSGRDQLWIMNADGSNPRQLLALDGDCWDPVWLK
jgi:TolB protein